MQPVSRASSKCCTCSSVSTGVTRESSHKLPIRHFLSTCARVGGPRSELSPLRRPSAVRKKKGAESGYTGFFVWPGGRLSSPQALSPLSFNEGAAPRKEQKTKWEGRAQQCAGVRGRRNMCVAFFFLPETNPPPAASHAGPLLSWRTRFLERDTLPPAW